MGRGCTSYGIRAIGNYDPVVRLSLIYEEWVVLESGILDFLSITKFLAFIRLVQFLLFVALHICLLIFISHTNFNGNYVANEIIQDATEIGRITTGAGKTQKRSNWDKKYI